MVPRPVFGHGLVFFVNDFERPELWAIRPGGSGDVTDSHVVWRIGQRCPPSRPCCWSVITSTPSAIRAIASCIDAQTGKVVWKERLGGNFAASPIYADGRIYFFSPGRNDDRACAGAGVQASWP